MKITVTGVGEDSLVTALFFGEHYNTTLLSEEIVSEDVDCPNLQITGDERVAYKGADYIIVNAETSYDSELNLFDSSAVEKTISRICSIERDCVIVIKSTVPIGFTERIKNKFCVDNIIVVPDFSRKGHEMYDLENPYRTIIGEQSERARSFAEVLLACIEKKDVQVLYMESTEAEAVKLFANSYLAMRVAFFNELDTFAETRELNTRNIIDGVCTDPRIGNLYNNPSFGYGGIYLQDSAKQLKANFADIDEELMSSIVKANKLRKTYIAKVIEEMNPDTVGIYGISIAHRRHEFIHSPERNIIKKLIAAGIDVVMYEPDIEVEKYYNTRVIDDIDEFKAISDIILVDRYDSALDDVADKVYTRDIKSDDN